MLRTLAVTLTFLLWTGLLLIPVFLSVALTFSGNASAWMARNLWAPVILWVAGIRIQIDPPPALDPRQSYVFVCNHQGIYDIPAAIRILPFPLRFVAKSSLAPVPVLGWYLKLAGHVLIDRTNRHRAKRSLDLAARKVAAGVSILIYPEGTRSPDGTIRPFKKGPFQLALAAQVPIVTVAIEGSQRINGKGSLRTRPGLLRIRLGEPIPTTGLVQRDREALMRQVHDRLIDSHLAIGGLGGDRAHPIAAADGADA